MSGGALDSTVKAWSPTWSRPHDPPLRKGCFADVQGATAAVIVTRSSPWRCWSQRCAAINESGPQQPPERRESDDLRSSLRPTPSRWSPSSSCLPTARPP